MGILYHVFSRVARPVTPPSLGTGNPNPEPNACPQHARCDDLSRALQWGPHFRWLTQDKLAGSLPLPYP